MGLIALYWGCMIVCYLIAAKFRHRKELFGWSEKALNIDIYFICLIMGLRMGSNEEVTSSLSTIGVQSLIVTVMCVTGSMFFVFITRKIMGLGKDGGPKTEVSLSKEESEKSKVSNSDSIRFTIIVLVLVSVGMLLGYFAIPGTIGYAKFEEMSSIWLTIGIALLLAFVGLTLGISGEVFKNVKVVGIKVVFFPIAAVLGSLVMGAVFGLLSPLTVREGLAISSGFGWYTFAPGVIIDSGHAVAGAVSFMHNVIRETLGIIIIPLATKKIGALEATSIPGVAAMDICVPIVERSNERPEIVVYSFMTGLLMCLCVPTLVPLFIG